MVKDIFIWFSKLFSSNIRSLGLVVNIVICAILLFFASTYGKRVKSLKLRQLTLLAIFAAIASAMRGALAFIPSAKPTSFIIIMAGVLMGPAAGFIIGIVITVLSSFFVGFGPYVPWQMLLWGLMGLSAGYMKDANRWVLAIFGFIWGFVFGWVMDLCWPLLGFMPLNRASIISGIVSSLPFDLLHASANFILLLLLPKSLFKIYLNKTVTK